MEFNVNISDTDKLILENDLMDIDLWIQNAVRGKINNCKKRMQQEWLPKLLNDPDLEAIPVNIDDLIALIVNRDDYQNRSDREADKGELE